MKYNYVEIGKRIREERTAKKWSQDKLCDEVKISRNTLSALENGEPKKLDFQVLLDLCNLFDCEMGYLLCEYDECKTRDDQFIFEQTGLKRESINVLKEINSDPKNYSHIVELLNQFLIYENPNNGRYALFEIAQTALDLKDLVNARWFGTLDQRHLKAGLLYMCQEDFMDFIQSFIQK